MRQQPPRDIRERTFAFGAAIVRFCRDFSDAPGVNRYLATQLLRAGTSIGANLEEAKAAYTRREFVVKNSIALKEARETLYWLRLVAACTGAPPWSLAPLAEESHELVAILTATVKTLKTSSHSSTSPSHLRDPL